jgi:hypothetical protein
MKAIFLLLEALLPLSVIAVGTYRRASASAAAAPALAPDSTETRPLHRDRLPDQSELLLRIRILRI